MEATASTVVRMAGRKRSDVNTDAYSGRLAVRVRSLRELRGLTVIDLAARLGISPNTVYAYEAGRREIPADLYPRLAKVLDCKTPSDLFPPLR